MEFYRDISYYYDSIFPFKQVTYNFLLESFKLSKGSVSKDSRILDIACGSGSYALNFALEGGQVIGTDLDPLMIEQAKAKNNKSNLEFRVHNMLELNQLKGSELGYDFIYCIGNSIVHLDSFKEIKTFISSVYEQLNEGGVFVVQIINFDRILQDNVKKLPTIYNDEEGVSFKRFYIHHKSEGKIEFSTLLDIETHRMTEQYSQSVLLYPLQAKELTESFKLSGFENIELFGGFDGSEYDKDTSYPTIIRGVKLNK